MSRAKEILKKEETNEVDTEKSEAFDVSQAIKSLSEVFVKDEIGKFWVVTKPTKESILLDILFESDILGMGMQFKGGLKKDEIIGFYKKGSSAKAVATKLLKNNKTDIKV